MWFAPSPAPRRFRAGDPFAPGVFRWYTCRRLRRLLLVGLAGFSPWCGGWPAPGARAQSAPAPATAATASPPAPTAGNSPAPSSPPPAAAASPAPVPLAEIAEQSQTATAVLNNVEPADQPDATLTAVRGALPELSDRINLLLAEGNRTTGTGNASLDALRSLQEAWRKLGEDLDDRATALDQRAKALDGDVSRTKQVAALWQATERAAREAEAPPETLGRVRAVLDAAEAAAQRVKVNHTSVLELQSRVSELGGRVQTAQGAVKTLQANAVRTLLDRDSLPVWAPRTWPDKNLLARNRASLAEQRVALGLYVRQQSARFAVHGMIFFALLGVILWLRHGLRQWTEQEPHLQRAVPVLEVPVAVALALSFLLKGPIYSDAPSLLRAVLGAMVLLPTIVILRRLLDRRLYGVLNSLVVFYLLDQVQVATAAFPRLNRWVFIVQMVGAVAVFVWLAVTERAVFTRLPAARTEDAAATAARPARPTFAARWVPRMTRLATVLLAAALVAGTLGYVRLGTLLGAATLRSGYVAVFLYALLSVLQGFVLIALRLRPVTLSRIVREHRDEVQRRANRVLAGAAVGFWLWETLDFFGVRTTLVNAVGGFLTRPLTVGSLSITPGHVLGFVGALWLAVLLSRAIRFFLDEEVYGRIHLAPGLPYAISTVLNYGVLLVGFLVGLGLLGVDLTKITIVASAFSVGLGFGLQNIINNFVSGVILLFERPIKVGDVVQIGDDAGEVRRIGIRASIIRTANGSDLIVPNGNLISNPVTNWTYSDRTRAVEVPLTVAAGPDLDRILELLRTTAAATQQSGGPDGKHAPQAFITGITAGNVSVVVRAWASRYEDWTRLRSNLSAALVAALAHAQIKLV